MADTRSCCRICCWSRAVRRSAMPQDSGASPVAHWDCRSERCAGQSRNVKQRRIQETVLETCPEVLRVGIATQCEINARGSSPWANRQRRCCCRLHGPTRTGIARQSALILRDTKRRTSHVDAGSLSLPGPCIGGQNLRAYVSHKWIAETYIAFNARTLRAGTADELKLA